MKIHWVENFYNLAVSKGIKCSHEPKIQGWIETINVNGKKYFTKSVTYNKKQFFLGVDPLKLEDNGDYVLICGGKESILSDIFIIPWDIFFDTLKKGKPLNSFKPPKKEYYQYKSYIRDRNNCWFMSVQGGERPIFDISKWHYNADKALAFINSV